MVTECRGRVVQNMTLERELALHQKCGDSVMGHGPRVLSGYQQEVTTLKVGAGHALDRHFVRVARVESYF